MLAVQAAVRQHHAALAYAFNFDDYNAMRGKGILTRATGPFARQRRQPRRHRPAVLRPRQGQASWAQEYEQETGQPLNFSFTTTQAASTVADAQFWQQAEAAGMGVEIVTVDQSTQIDTAITGDFQAIGWRNHPGGDPDEQYVWWNSTYLTTSAASRTRRSTAAGRRPHQPRPGRPGRHLRGPEQAVRRRGLQPVELLHALVVATATDVHGAGRGPDQREPFPGLAVGNPVTYMWVEQ